MVSGGRVWPCVASAGAPMASGRQSIDTPCSSAAARAMSTAAGTISRPMSSPSRMPMRSGAADLARRRRRAVRGDVALQQRVAVGRRVGGGLAGDHAAAAALVLDDEVLPEGAAPTLADDAGDHVVAAARGDRDDVADRPGGIGLGPRQPRQGQGRRCRLQQMASLQACLRSLCGIVCRPTPVVNCNFLRFYFMRCMNEVRC